MIDRISDAFRFDQQALGLREQRQEVLSSNIANADTPNYKSRDFDFKAAMQGALEGRLHLPDTHLTLTSTRHIPGKAMTPNPVELQYRQPFQPSLDGNTVDMDAERIEFADNTMRYQTGLTVLSSRLKGLLTAMQP